MRTIDKSKRINRKCEHCGYFARPNQFTGICLKTGRPMEYWRKCALFSWDETKRYKPVEGEGT